MGVIVTQGRPIAIGGDIVAWKSRGNVVFIDKKKFGISRNVLDLKSRTVTIDGKKFTRGTVIENWKPQKGSVMVDGNKVTLVMIGTWPTPEKPTRRKSRVKNKRTVKSKISR